MSSQRINRSVSILLQAIRRTNPRTRPYCHRRCKRRGNSTTIDSLPDELLSEILVRISAEDLHENARMVCKRWKRIIHGDDFVYAHLQRTSHGLLFSTRRGVGGTRATFVAATRGSGGIEESELSCKLKSPIDCSCNGLITGMDIYKNPVLLYIVNPSTKRRFDLPRFFDTAVLRSFGIAYAAASMEYKAVATYLDDPDSKDLQCAILTVGVDESWRRVATQQLTYYKACWFRNTAPLITEGFMHWAYWSEYVVTMNVETEVIADTPAPLAHQEYLDQGFEYSYLSTGRNLCLLFSCGKLSWEVWELKGETMEWSKLLPNIDCRSKTQQFGWKDDVPLKPVGWVKYPELLLFSYAHSCLLYDLVNDEMESVELPPPVIRDAVMHKQSLVCLS